MQEGQPKMQEGLPPHSILAVLLAKTCRTMHQRLLPPLVSAARRATQQLARPVPPTKQARPVPPTSPPVYWKKNIQVHMYTIKYTCIPLPTIAASTRCSSSMELEHRVVGRLFRSVRAMLCVCICEIYVCTCV